MDSGFAWSVVYVIATVPAFLIAARPASLVGTREYVVYSRAGRMIRFRKWPAVYVWMAVVTLATPGFRTGDSLVWILTALAVALLMTLAIRTTTRQLSRFEAAADGIAAARAGGDPEELADAQRDLRLQVLLPSPALPAAIFAFTAFIAFVSGLWVFGTLMTVGSVGVVGYAVMRQLKKGSADEAG